MARSTATSAQSVGARAEKLALEYLQGRGLRLVSRNFRCRYGEIDLIMRDRQQLVFVEVRYRLANRIADAAVSVGPAKQRRIIRTASLYAAASRERVSAVMRFDVVAIDGTHGGCKRIRWLRDAFRP